MHWEGRGSLLDGLFDKFSLYLSVSQSVIVQTPSPESPPQSPLKTACRGGDLAPLGVKPPPSPQALCLILHTDLLEGSLTISMCNGITILKKVNANSRGKNRKGFTDGFFLLSQDIRSKMFIKAKLCHFKCQSLLIYHLFN